MRALENILFLNDVYMWTSVVTHLGLYIFIESLWKNRIYFPFVVEAVACVILSCGFTYELLGN